MKRSVPRSLLLTVTLFYIFLASSAAQAAPLDDFVITVKTDNPGISTDTQFTIPTYSGESYNYNVDCDNDGSDEATAQTGDYTCNYASAGTYTVRIKDNSGAGSGFPMIFFNNSGDNKKLLTIEQWGTGKWTSMWHAFYGCSNLAGQAGDTPDLLSVIDMGSMFRGATSFNQDIGSWDTSNIQLMNHLFFGASSFNQEIGEWDTSAVVDMSRMFQSATSFNQDIGSWDTSKIVDMTSMFAYASAFNQDIGGWDVGALAYAAYMFDGATLSTTNYDALLIDWNAQALQSGVTFDGGNSTYCIGEAARSNMINSDGWIITDGGKACGQVDLVFLPLMFR